MYKVIYDYMISIDMKLTQQQMQEAYNEVKLGHHEPVGVIMRAGGDKEDYQKLYQILKGYATL